VSPDGANRSTVVCVDDDRMVLDLLTTMLARVGEFTVEGFTDPRAALRRIREGGVHCVVSDYEMPGLDGLELLERSREFDPGLPFIVYTGRGSEEVAVEAISRGATDYVRKEQDTTQYALLGHRIEAAVARYHAEREIARRLEVVEIDREGICIVRPDGTIEYANGSYLDLYGYRADELFDAEWRLLHPSAEVERIRSDALPVVEERGEWTGESVGRRADGTTFRERMSIVNLPDGGLVVVVGAVEDVP
jgi:PAS domain S-box-containing protein